MKTCYEKNGTLVSLTPRVETLEEYFVRQVQDGENDLVDKKNESPPSEENEEA